MTGTVAQVVRELVEIELGEQIIDSLGTHLGDELVRIAIVEIAVAFGKFLLNGKIIFLTQEFIFLQSIGLVAFLCALGDAGNNIETACGLINDNITWIDDDVTLIIDDRVELLGRKTEQIANLVGQRAEIPEMGHGDHKLDVTATLATNLLLGNLNTASVAHDVAITDALVFTAMALIVLNGAKNALAEV